MFLYVSDLDGTLLNNNAIVSPNSKDLINKFLKDNVNFTVATARTPATVSKLLKDINLTLPIITMNGSAIYDLQNDKYLYSLPLENNLVPIIQNLIDSENLNAFVYTLKDNHLFVYHNKLINPYQIKFYNERKDSTYKTFIEGPVPSDCRVLYFTIMDYEDKVNSLYNKLKGITGISPIKYRDTYDKKIMNLEIYHTSSSKANAINYLKNYFHFDKLITFGDNLNDIPMFKISDECYAVENAAEELKNISTKVIDSNDKDAVAKFILEHSNK